MGIVVSAALATLLDVHPAAAQGDQPLEEITVTGSRIVRRDFEANSPIMTVDAERFEDSSTIAIESVVNQLPQFVPGVTQFNPSPGDSGARATEGAATLSLRGLGANRNLILLDGRRAMPVNAGMIVDINTIPSAAIARVETITGGASSVYGADAIAGVVNFILRDDFDGIDFDVQYGQTAEGDGTELRLSALMGATFEGGNVMFGFQHSERDQVYQRDREFYRNGWADPFSSGDEVFHTAFGLQTQAGNNPSQAVVDSIFDQVPAGTVGTTSNFYFNPDGTLYREASDGAYRYNGPTSDVYGSALRFVSGYEGTLEENNTYALLQSPLKRYSLFSKANMELTSRVNMFAQAMFSESDTRTSGGTCCLLGGWSVDVPHGDELYAPSVDALGNTRPDFLSGGRHGLNCPPVGGCTESQAWPVSPEAEMLLSSRPDPNDVFSIRTSSVWDGPRRNQIDTTNFQLIAGLEGEFPNNDWTWEIYGSRGSTRTTNLLGGRISLARWRWVMSQVPNYGAGMFYTGNEQEDGFSAGTAQCTTGFPVFRSANDGLSGWMTNTTVDPSQDCRDAVIAHTKEASNMEQTVAEFNMQGGLIDMPAGQLRFALGTAYRENTFEWLADTLNSQESFLDLPAGQFPRSNTRGETSSSEIYGELLVPLLAGKPGVQELNLELGYRNTHNNPTDAVDSYKALIDWRITDRVRFRGGRQIANRAPNIAELFQSSEQQTLFSPRGEWCSTENPTNTLSPNPNINPNAAEVLALCQTLMGPNASLNFYSEDQNDSAFQWRFSDLIGNPLVQNEQAETYTAGIVADLTDRASLTLDYWNINVSDMIAAQSPDVIYTQCFSPDVNPGFDPNFAPCQQIVRDPVSGGGANTLIFFTNEGAIDYSGVDIQFDWGGDGGNLGPGAFNVNFLATINNETLTRVDPNAEWTDWTGTSGPSDLTGIDNFTYDYKTFTTVGYNTGNWTASLRWRHLPSIASEASIGNPFSTFTPTNAYNMFDVSGRISLRNYRVRFGIDNVFDVDPELTFPDAEDSGTGSTNSSIYDVLGRRFYVGVGIEF